MDLLSAVNRILPKLGEHTVTSLTARSPTLALLLPMIEDKVKEMTIRGWWFNTHNITLSPDGDGVIAVAPECLSFVADDYECSIRARKLHNTELNNYTWTTSVKGTAIMLVAFDELPETVAQWVFYSALAEAYVTDIGLTQEARAWDAMIDPCAANVLSEHLRNKRYSSSRGRSFRNIYRAMRA